MWPFFFPVGTPQNVVATPHFVVASPHNAAVKVPCVVRARQRHVCDVMPRSSQDDARSVLTRAVTRPCGRATTAAFKHWTSLDRREHGHTIVV